MHSQTDRRTLFDGWRGIGLVAATYIYFLIFAQFGFLKRLAQLGIADGELKGILGAMALGGIAGSLLAPRCEGRWHPTLRLRVAFAGCGIGACLALAAMNGLGALLVAAWIGAWLGVLTVTLVTHLELWIGNRQPLLKIGGGVGAAYLICTCPPLFDAPPAAMALASAALCLLAMGITGSKPGMLEGSFSLGSGRKAPPFLLILGCFTALVWLDSAAFFIIQNTPTLKAGTWEGTRRLWQIGLVHFLVALGSAALLNRQGVFNTLAIAFTLLGGACLVLTEPARAALASLLYPAGVSLYSVALVAYPSFLAPSNSGRGRAGSAGWLYAIAGWFGSGLGIGMGENLRHIPPGFVLTAAVLFVAPLSWSFLPKHRREALTLLTLFCLAWALHRGLLPGTPRAALLPPPALVERGRQVYIAEGCVHCHSQYVRPNSSDELLWGRPASLALVCAESPPLIGNRRQGPDLANVGNRRSPLWLTAHFMNPSEVSHGSIMPPYKRLFRNDRGQALVAYLSSLGEKGLAARLLAQSAWEPSTDVLARAQKLDGRALFQQHCATCHAADGLTRRACQSRFKRLPPDLAAGPLIYAPVLPDPARRLIQIAKIIKFGLPGTDMPGHEYLLDEQTAAIARHVVALAERNRPRKALPMTE